tara:strand:+ start:1777 stop:2862 length:1086 start_codon:yes stop_codon:yes gene_type:complete
LKTIHLVYPFDLKKKIVPWEEGNQIYKSLNDVYKFKNYNWMSFDKINPEPGDILLGHPNSFPFTSFRRSIKNPNWEKVIIFQPYNEDPLQLSYINKLIPYCDQFIALCGKYWFNRIRKSIFKEWHGIIDHIDLGINNKLFPFIKKKINPEGKRRFLYIGNDYSYNNFAKNTKYLEQISKKFDDNLFGSIGNKNFSNFKNYGWLNFNDRKSLKIIKKYDFLISTSSHDANPSTILEGMSWGLLPVITKETGYKESSIYYLPLNSLNEAVKRIKKIQNLNEEYLKKIQSENLNLVKNKYNWGNYRKRIRHLILKKKNNKIKISEKTNKIFIFYEKRSPNYFLNPVTIYNIIKANISILIKKIV